MTSSPQPSDFIEDLAPIRLSPFASPSAMEFFGEVSILRDVLVDPVSQDIVVAGDVRRASGLSWLHGGSARPTSAQPETIRVDRCVLAPAANIGNYFHFVFEFCAGLWLASLLTTVEDSFVVADCPVWMDGLVEESATAFIPGATVIAGPDTPLVHARELVVPRFALRDRGSRAGHFELPRWAAAGYSKAFLSAMRDRFLGTEEPRCTSPAAYNPRSDAAFRRDPDEDHSKLLCERLGIAVMPKLYQWSMARQAAWFSGISSLVAIHGAGNSNVCFMPPGSRFVELFADGYCTGQFTVVADILGLDYSYARFPPTQETQALDPIQQSPAIDPTVLARLLGGSP